MASKKRFAINVVMNWVAMATGMVVPFFLTPFVVRHLGSLAYGVWILAVSTVAYLNLLDLGLRSAIVRFVSKNTTAGKIIETQKTIGAALWLRFGMAAMVALLSIALAVAFPHLFKVPHDLQHAGQITVLLCALGVAVSLVSGVFGGVLSGISRFDVLSLISVSQTLARAIGVIFILRSGHGLVALAYWELAVGLMGESCDMGLSCEDLSAMSLSLKPAGYCDLENDLVVQLQDLHHYHRRADRVLHRQYSRWSVFVGWSGYLVLDCREPGDVLGPGFFGDGSNFYTDGERSRGGRANERPAKAASAWHSGRYGTDAAHWYYAAVEREDIYRPVGGIAI